MAFSLHRKGGETWKNAVGPSEQSWPLCSSARQRAVRPRRKRRRRMRRPSPIAKPARRGGRVRHEGGLALRPEGRRSDLAVPDVRRAERFAPHPARQGGQSLSQAELQAAALRLDHLRPGPWEAGPGNEVLLCARRIGHGGERRREGNESRMQASLRPTIRRRTITTGCTSTSTATWT